MGTLLFTGFCFTVKPSQGDHQPQNRSHNIGLWLKYWNSWLVEGGTSFFLFLFSRVHHRSMGSHHRFMVEVSRFSWLREEHLSFFHLFNRGFIWYLTLDQSIPNIWTRIVFSFNISWQRSCNVLLLIAGIYSRKGFCKCLTNIEKEKRLWSSMENGWEEGPFLHDLADDVWFLETSPPAPASCGLEAFSQCHRTIISNGRITTQKLELVHTYILFKS